MVYFSSNNILQSHKKQIFCRGRQYQTCSSLHQSISNMFNVFFPTLFKVILGKVRSQYWYYYYKSTRRCVLKACLSRQTFSTDSFNLCISIDFLSHSLSGKRTTWPLSTWNLKRLLLYMWHTHCDHRIYLCCMKTNSRHQQKSWKNTFAVEPTHDHTACELSSWTLLHNQTWIFQSNCLVCSQFPSTHAVELPATWYHPFLPPLYPSSVFSNSRPAHNTPQPVGFFHAQRCEWFNICPVMSRSWEEEERKMQVSLHLCWAVGK